MKLSLRLIIAAAFTAPLSLAQIAFTNDVLALNPLGYWKLDGSFVDATHKNLGGDGNPINPIGYTLAGGGAPIGDPVGQAAVLNSSQGQYVNISAGEPGPSTTFDLSASQPFTLMAWVKTANQGLSTMIVVGKVDASQTGYALVINNNPPFAPLGAGRFGLLLDSQGMLSEVESTVSVNDGAWHFLVGTYAGSGQQAGIQLYLDGAPVPTLAAPQHPQVAGSILNNSALTIGAIPAVGSAAPSFEGLIDEVAVFGTALTQTQVQRLAGDAVTARKILPQFAFSGGWYSAAYFSNTGIATVSFTVTFTANDGTPLTIPSLGGASTTLTIPPGGTAVIEAFNTGPTTIEGYVSATLPPGVIGYGVFRQSIPGKPDQEAVVPFSGANRTTSTLLFDEMGSLVTAVAIANPSPVALTVTVTFLKADGSMIGTTSFPLLPNAKTTKLLRDLASGVIENRGTAIFSVTSGNVALLGLRVSGIALTSIPTTDQ